MKRADTGAASFTTISWGKDVLEMVEYEEPVFAGELIQDAEQEVVNISASQAAAFESGRIVTKGSGVNQVQTLDWGNIGGAQGEQGGDDRGCSDRRKNGKDNKRSVRDKTSEDTQTISLRIQPSRTTDKRGKHVSY